MSAPLVNRRGALRLAAAAAGALAAAAGSAAEGPGPAADPTRRSPSGASGLAGAPATPVPWPAALKGLDGDLPPVAMTLQGRLPRELRGAFFRNGAARHALGGLRYAHWFDGDGAIQRYDIADGGIQHRASFVRTERFVAESAAGRRLRQSYGTAVAQAEPLLSPDSVNAANTSVVQHAGRLLALWEAGSAHAVDAKTLATIGPVQWATDLAGLPFSAHPRIEPDGTMWNFGASQLQGLLTIYRIGADGRLAQHHTLRVPDLPMLHDFAVTERHLVFLLPPFVFEPERFMGGALFHDSHRWRPELGLRAMVLDKAQLDAPPRWFTLPAGFVFHLGNAYEQGGVIRLDCMRSPTAWQVQRGMMEMMGTSYVAQDHTQLMSVELELASGRARQEVLPVVGEFPRVDPRYTGREYRQVFAALHMSAARRPGYDAVMRVDMQSGRIDRYAYGDSVLVEEHVFVPHARRGQAREGEGWLLGSALDVARGETVFSVFDATQLAAGPLAQARMPRLVPLGLHGSFVPA